MLRSCDLFGPQVMVVNQFGSTEAGGIALHEIHPSDELDDEQQLPMGIPWGSATLVLVDEHGDAVPDGEPGRLLAVSHQAAIGIGTIRSSRASASSHSMTAAAGSARATERVDGQTACSSTSVVSTRG